MLQASYTRYLEILLTMFIRIEPAPCSSRQPFGAATDVEGTS